MAAVTERPATSLANLAEAAEALVHDGGPAPEAAVTGLAYDSARVQPGDLFFCIRGARADGHDFAPQAVVAGAAALCVERPLGLGVPEVLVPDARRAMARMAAEFYGRPADDLMLVGVTGTNGKTTTAFLVESILSAAAHTTGLIGTIETRIAGESRAGVRTTPDSLDLHALFAEMRSRGVTAVAMEVTSHALALRRVEGLRFTSAAFTNLSQDHLDFHADMEDYFAAKRSLFVPQRTQCAAVNIDDPYGRRLWSDMGVPCLGFGASDDADVRSEDVRLLPSGNEFVIVTPAGELKVATALVGAFNVSNSLAACAVALQAGIELGAIESGLRELPGVPGRFEAVDAGQPFAVIVDYAHTPDSLDNVLREARRLAEQNGGRVVCVFGCGGDRDRGKRPLMGTAAGRLADVVVVTSDNPRSEDPNVIIEQILSGVAAVRPEGADIVDPDRRSAITAAIREAQPNDVVVVAGKGHETGQELADRMIPFDDRDVAHDALRDAGWEKVHR